MKIFRQSQLELQSLLLLTQLHLRPLKEKQISIKRLEEELHKYLQSPEEQWQRGSLFVAITELTLIQRSKIIDNGRRSDERFHTTLLMKEDGGYLNDYFMNANRLRARAPRTFFLSIGENWRKRRMVEI
jgi:hypothetical protein